MNDFIEALKEVKKYSKDFKITLSKKEVLEITDEIERLTKVEKEHQRINGELREENKKLNNIINEIEKDLKDRYYGRGKYNLSTDIVGIPTFLNRIKELKGSDKHE